MNTLGIFVKQPQAGRVKTRLATDWGDERAATLYESFILDLADQFRTCGDRRELCYAPNDPAAQAYFGEIAGTDYSLWPQPDESLGSRMQQFFVDRLCNDEKRVVIIGSDSPTLPHSYVESAFELLNSRDCVIGPATDGGYYLIGQRFPAKDLFAGIEWSRSGVLRQTVERMRSFGLSFSLLSPWYDVDTIDDVEMLTGHIAAMRGAAEDAVSIPERTARQLLMDIPR